MGLPSAAAAGRRDPVNGLYDSAGALAAAGRPPEHRGCPTAHRV